MTDRLFKFGSVEQEIMNSMESSLVRHQKDRGYGHDKLNKAVDLLNAAAEIFDDTGFTKEAEIITRLIEKMACGDNNNHEHGHNHIGDMINETLGKGRTSPINKMIEEEVNKKEIEDLMSKKHLTPDEPFDVTPSSRSADLEGIFSNPPTRHMHSGVVPKGRMSEEDLALQEIEEMMGPRSASKKKV